MPKKNDPYGVEVKKKGAKKGFPQILSTMQKNCIQKYFFFYFQTFHPILCP